jgi:WD40 repeat protein
MRREPAERYADARELAADLKRFVTGQLVGAHHYSRRVLAMRAIRRHPVITAVALSLVALIVVGVVALRRITAEQAATERRSRELLLGQARAMLETDPTAAVALVARYPDPPATRAEADAVRGIVLDAESRGVARQVLAAHGGAVRDAAFSPDGAELATVGGDGALIVWNLATGAHEQLHQSTTNMDAVGYDPRGRYLAASLGPKLGVVLWDRQQRTSRVLPTESDVYTLDFSPDGAALVAGDASGLIHVWTCATGAARELAGHEAWASSVVVSPDGARVLSTSSDATARIWTLATGEARVIPLDDEGYWGVFSRDGKTAAIGSIDGAVRVVSVDDAAVPPRLLRGDTRPVDYLDFSPDGRTLAWAGMGETVFLADLATATGEIRAMHGHGDDVTGLAFAADGVLVTSSADATLRVWDVATGFASVLRGHRDEIMAMAVSADGRMVASASVDRTARVWVLPARPRTFVIDASRESDLRAPATNDVLYYYSEGERAAVLDFRTNEIRPVTTTRGFVRLAGNPTGTQVAYRDPQRRVALVDLATGQEHDLPMEYAHHGRVIDYSPDGSTVVYAGKDGIYAVDAATFAVRSLPYPSGPMRDDDIKVMQLEFAADGRRALTVGKDLVIWDLGAGTGTTVPPPPALTWPSTVVGSPDFSRLAAGAVGGLALHDAGGWHLLRATDRAVAPITFSHDGAWLAAADDSGDLRLWRVAAGGATGETPLVGHRGPIRHLEFSPDGAMLISAGSDGMLRTWGVATGQQIAAVRAHGGRAVEWVGLRGADLVTAGRDGTARVWTGFSRAPVPVRDMLSGLTTFRDSPR